MTEENKNTENSEPIVQEFKGNKILVLNPDSQYKFSFGLSKAKLILDKIEFIRKFVDENSKKD